MLFGIIGAALPVSAKAASADQIATARTKALAWLYQSQNTDGSWGSVPGLQVTATSAAIDALLAAGVNRGATYNAAVSVLANAQPASTDGLARQLETLYRAGSDTSVQITQLNAAANAVSAWGTLPGQGSNVADTALALIALLDASSTYPNYNLGMAICNAIVPGQTALGGWSYAPQPFVGSAPPGLSTPAILPTAYAMLALQKIKAGRFSSLGCGGISYTLSTLTSNGLAWLLTKKNADGGFGENGTSGALETALACRAIAAVSPGHAALGTAQDYLIASQNANGAWAADPLQTAFVLQSLAGAPLTDTQGNGVPDAVAAVLWPGGQGNPRTLVSGNGQSVSGKTASIVVGSGSLNQPFSGRLPTPAGRGPFIYRLVSGALPDGVTLAADGTLSGTPTTTGVFNFGYQAIDADGLVSTLAGQIATDNGASDGDVPTLPEWGAILLACLLLTAVARQQQPAR